MFLLVLKFSLQNSLEVNSINLILNRFLKN